MTGGGQQTIQHTAGALAIKVALRACVLPDRPVKVLDAFHGDGDIWRLVEQLHPHDIDVVGVEKDRERARPGVLTGDNVRVLAAIKLDRFDMIDLDAWGIPWEQLRIISRAGFEGPVAVTWINTMGMAYCRLWEDLGVPGQWMRDVHSLFTPNVEAARFWLGHLGWTRLASCTLQGKKLYGVVGHDQWSSRRFDRMYRDVISLLRK